jgi:hypothetical protein
VSLEAVRKAISSKRLLKSITKDDPPQILDVALADREWAANTDLTRAPIDIRERHGRSQATEAGTDKPGEASAAAGAAAEAPGRDTTRGRVLTFNEPQGHGGELRRDELVPDVSIAAASAAEKHWRSKKAELDYKRAAGELVDAKEITASFTQLIVTSRTKLLGLPTKAKSRLPHLTLEDLAVLEEIVRESLEELAS